MLVEQLDDAVMMPVGGSCFGEYAMEERNQCVYIVVKHLLAKDLEITAVIVM